MEAKIATKVARYLELSGKFSKTWTELYPNEPVNSSNGTIRLSSFPSYSSDGSFTINTSNTISVSGTFVINGKEIYVDKDGNVKAKDQKNWTRADDIRAAAEIKAVISDELDEYNKLRYELTEYFNALKKITE